MFPVRRLYALILAIALTACGGQYDIDPSTSLAGSTAVAAPANMPVPDCAAEGCASLRIIDGNAEAWRIDAQRRAEHG